MNRKGVSRIEVLVTFAAVGLLFAIAAVAISRSRETAARAQCQSQMRQLGIALHTAQDTYARMPPHCGSYPIAISKEKQQRPVSDNFEASVFFWLLPFLDSANLQTEFLDLKHGDSQLASSWDEAVAEIHFSPPRYYLCPSMPGEVSDTGLIAGEPVMTYAVNLSIFWRANAPIKIPNCMPDGPSQTVMVFERYAQCGDVRNNPWGKADVRGANLYGKSDWVEEALYTVDGESPPSFKNPYKMFQHQPANENCDPYTAQGPHTGGINILMGDASVKRVAPVLTKATWHAAIVPNDLTSGCGDW